jgi:hypothetical protein
LEKTIGVAQVCASCQLPQFSFPSNMACWK